MYWLVLVASSERIAVQGKGRNPKTGEVMEIPARQVPAFSAGKLFKGAVAAGKFPEENRIDYHKRLHQS